MTDPRAVQIAAWADSPAEHAHAAEMLAQWGEDAIPGLRGYLCRDPQVIPQPRCFAVAMLARLHADAATSALRDVLHAHPLHTLAPAFAEAEYVVKCDVVDALAVRVYAARDADIACGVSERLRAAVIAAGRLRLTAIADALVDLLDDDVLAEAAMQSLAALGAAAGNAITPRLDAWLTEAELSARRRLALIRALRVLRQTSITAKPAPALRRALADAHPAVRAAAALLAWPTQRDGGVIEALLHGALGFDRDLADACRVALDASDVDVGIFARAARQRNAEPDLYGKPRPLSPAQRDWLAVCGHRPRRQAGVPAMPAAAATELTPARAARAHVAVERAEQYVRSRQSPDGGFCFYRWGGVEEASLADTWHAVASLVLLGAAVPRRADVLAFVRQFRLTGADDRYHAARILNLLGEPAHAAAVARAAIAVPDVRTVLANGRAPVTGRLALALHRVVCERAVAACGDARAIADSVLALRHRGGWGEKANLEDTWLALSLLGACGTVAPMGSTRDFVDGLQVPSFGFTATRDSAFATLDVVHAGLRACWALGIAVRHAGDAVDFILACRSDAGSFARTPDALPNLALTHRGLLALVAAGAIPTPMERCAADDPGY